MADYVVTALLRHDGKILFPIQSEIETIADCEMGTHEAIFREPIQWDAQMLVWSQEDLAWVSIAGGKP